MIESQSREVILPGVRLFADLRLPNHADALIMLVHGGGERTHSNHRYVADALARRGQGSLLLDLVTDDERLQDNPALDPRFDIDLLSARLVQVIDWVNQDSQLCSMELGLLGADTGGAVALVAAAKRPTAVAAVVCQGGRTELTGSAVTSVSAPTLQIVGAQDPEVFKLNCQTSRILQCEQRLIVVPGASHLFDEPGALEDVARLAGDWFERYVQHRSRAHRYRPNG